MPQETQSIPKYLGIENEFGCIFKNEKTEAYANELAGHSFVFYFNPTWLGFRKSGAWDPKERMSGLADANDARTHSYYSDESWQSCLNFLLPNGARFYCDLGHPEISTPLARNAIEAITYDRACERIMEIIAKIHEETRGKGYLLFKNNRAHGFEAERNRTDSSVSFATHENYLVKRSVPVERLIGRLLPFLAIRTVLIGAGFVEKKQSAKDVPYQISQRADFFTLDASVKTTGLLRPLMNLRDRPYADPSRYRRLHVISGDANMCEVAQFIKHVTMQVLLMMVEDDYLDDRFSLKSHIQSFHEVSRDPEFKKKLTRSNNLPSRTAIDMLKEYVDLMWNYLEDFGIRDETLRAGIQKTGDMLRRLELNPEACFGTLDHVTKRILIENAMARGKITSWRDERARQYDLRYHATDKNRSIFYHPKTYSHMERVTTDEAIERAIFETTPTRCRFMVEVHRRFGFALWDWRKFSIKDESGKNTLPIFLDDPLAPWESLSPILSDDRGEFIRNVEDAGFFSGAPPLKEDDEDVDEKRLHKRGWKCIPSFQRILLQKLIPRKKESDAAPDNAVNEGSECDTPWWRGFNETVDDIDGERWLRNLMNGEIREDPKDDDKKE
ncbi:MAG: hypothetical protein A2934_00500 [Candidatus Sungbacteria bacterium RIFCSPLOWO2_01_FULL_47_10]|uniref:Proteasome accessory factor PafA2 n=1 Tax=Candidatus Sungbacteria bacterium RIFCSPLOWO2_01_FULL_47_10 TaxID=1802276 RepID=A0A1G2L2Z0_9BACT|nr:MAG: hypothetical protein A2934_00500 [Candidatus Sungbacteria bacterium RIFCSPLOWO2_01_FULL_47_10]